MGGSATDAYFDLVKEVVRKAALEPRTREEGLLWMALLHTHEITWAPGVVRDGAGPWKPLTNRGTADVIAAQWPSSAEEGNDMFWYYEYIHSGWERHGDIPSKLKEQISALAKRLAADPRIVSVVPED